MIANPEFDPSDGRASSAAEGELHTADEAGPAGSFAVAFGPAWIATGKQWRSAVEFEQMRCFLRDAQMQLSHSLGAALRLALCGAGEEFEAVFTICVGLGCDEALARVELSADAATAVLNPFLRRVGGRRTTGCPTAVELGLLEFVTLQAIDALVGGRTDCPAIRVLGFDESFRSIEGEPSAPIVLNLHAGAAVAPIRITTQEPSLHALLSSGGAAQPRADFLQCCVALPEVSLSRPERMALEVGDVLLCAARSVESLQAATIVSRTGWILADASIVHDSPTLIATEIQRPRCEPHRAFRGDSAGLMLPLVGSLPLTAAALAQWSAGRLVDFPKIAQSPVLLIEAGAVVGSAELVRAGPELGMRVLSLDR